jgi:acyl-CoA reductase-like NAD-dependent aldehyde dehydrogenase
MTRSIAPHEPPAPIDVEMLIAGQRRDGNGARLDVRNPAHPDEIVGSVPRGRPEDVDQAVAAARAAQPAWEALGYNERARILAACLTALDAGIEGRASTFVRENGKTLVEARNELVTVGQRQRLTLDLVDEMAQDRRIGAPHGRTIVMRRPWGVVVSIVPWNQPVGLAFLQIVPALLTGNTLVVKPPDTCPLTLMRSVELIAGLLPPGTVNLVTGLPGEIGERLTTHPDVAKIGFTGSVDSARHIMASAAGTIKGVTLELGGNDPAILLDDVDLDAETMGRLCFSVFRMAGQVCMAVKRIYVPRRLEHDFLEAFRDAAEQIVVGDGLVREVTMGPLHTARALERATGMLDDAVRRGGTVVPVGRIADPATHAEGHFMAPAIVTGLGEDAPLMAQEQFCPVIPVSAYDDVADAVRRANATVYGLGGSVWGADVERALEVASRLEAGTIFVNTHGTGAINRRAPYGGIKQSGIGRRAGREGLEEYVQTRTLTTYEQ